MRKLDHPLIDDDELLTRLRLSRSPRAIEVMARSPDISTRYQTYRDNRGDPWSVPEDGSFTALRPSLNHLYAYPPVAFDFIPTLRESVSGSCPVCGRDGIGTLDHYLPKANYSEYSFFSLNLVPACDRCNNARNNLARGAIPGERPIHPYFDAFAQRRVMTIRAEPDWRAPRLTPIPHDVAGDELLTVQWHIENVVRPAGIDAYITNLWASLVRRPQPFLGAVATRNAVRSELERQIAIEETVGQSPNAWRACFYHGLATNDEALEHLLTLV